MWSHSLDSGKTLKDCLEKMAVNSLRWSGIGAKASSLVWKASANCCKMVDEAQMFTDGGGSRPVARIQSPSPMEIGSSAGLRLGLELCSSPCSES